MKCDLCEKLAVVFLTQIVDGQMKKVCLCDSCAKQHGVTDPTGFGLADLVLGGGKKLGGLSASGVAIAGDLVGSGGKVCPSCGFTIEDLKRIRRMGCSACYQTFREEIELVVRGMHKGGVHIGKVPTGLVEKQVLHQRLEDCREQLKLAIDAENYELAAVLRDEIRKLEVGGV